MKGTQISATLNRITVIQHSGMIEEEDGQNDGRSVAGSDVLWQPLDFVIRVDYKSLHFNTQRVIRKSMSRIWKCVVRTALMARLRR